VTSTTGGRDGGGSLPTMPTEDTRLELNVDVDGVLVLSGEIDSYTATELAERLAGEPPVDVLDLAAVTFIDSSGLRVLVEAHQMRIERGTRLALRSPSAPVQRLLEISGLAGHLDVTS
jgi:anti-sigma B factor antagonist